MRERVLAPLGMAHTGFTYDEADSRPATTGYQRIAAPPHGGLVGGVDDVARLLLHLNHGVVDGTRLLPPEATEAMQRITPRGGAARWLRPWLVPAPRRR